MRLLRPLAVASTVTTGKQLSAFVAPVLLAARFQSARSKGENMTDLDSESIANTIRADLSCNATNEYDPEYPGTAVARMRAVRARVAQIAAADKLNGEWEDVRRELLWAGGLRDLPDAQPGQGYTGHSFNDYNHVDLTTMLDDVSENTNDGRVKGIAIGNRLGPGIRIASIPELGPGGSWSTCAMGCNTDPPQDVAHVQFRSRIAFKLVWVPNDRYDTFVLVDDDGELLALGTPSDGPPNYGLPTLRQRKLNYALVRGSKYARAADALVAAEAAE